MKKLTELQDLADALAAEVRAAETAIRATGRQAAPYLLAEVSKDLDSAVRGLRLASWQATQDAGLETTLRNRSLEAQQAA